MLSIKEFLNLDDKISDFFGNKELQNFQKCNEIAKEISEKHPSYNTG